MLRRDYFLRMIEDFFHALLRIRALKQGQNWQAASGTLDEEFNRLIGAGAQAVAKLSETELLARLIEGEPTQAIRDKTLFLTTLLNEAGDVAAAEGRTEDSRLCYLKGLHLLLDTLSRYDVCEFPDFVPRIEVFVTALQNTPLPLRTQAMLMQHYERTGAFALAENILFAMLDAEPANPDLLDFGIDFYERLQTQHDSDLTAGNLPRPELESALAELRARKTRE